MAALVLIAVAVGMEFFTPPVFRPAVRFDALSAAFYYSNWQFALESVNYLTFGGAQNPVLHYWSLSVEEQFYLVWPLLLLAAVKLRRKGRPARRVRLRCAIVVACVGASVARVLLVETAAQPAIAYFETTTRVWEFAAGAAIALGASYLRRIPLGRRRRRPGSPASLMLAAAAVVQRPDDGVPGYRGARCPSSARCS